MTKRHPNLVRFRGREESVLEVFKVHGRAYLAVELLSRRGAYRVFDRHAGPDGDYRVLHRIPYTRITRQKIETLRRLTGPTTNRNFPYIADFARQGHDLFVIMSWTWGTDLRDLLRSVRENQSPRPSVPEVVRLMRGLAHGVSHFHRRANVIHGDLSPANLIVTDGTKHLVLIDFGSAWPVEHTASKDGGHGATRLYAAPERIAGQDGGDFRSDVFSLSIIAYELLTLQIPFDGAGGLAATGESPGQFSSTLVPPSKLISPQPPVLPNSALAALDEYFRVGLALDPNGRFETGRQWLAAWDDLHNSLQKGTRLSRLEAKFVQGIEFLSRQFLGRSKPDAKRRLG